MLTRPTLKTLSLSRFRHIDGATLTNIGDINILIGPNNVGKTSFFRGVFQAESENPPDCSFEMQGFPSYNIGDPWLRSAFDSSFFMIHSHGITAIEKRILRGSELYITCGVDAVYYRLRKLHFSRVEASEVLLNPRMMRLRDSRVVDPQTIEALRINGRLEQLESTLIKALEAWSDWLTGSFYLWHRRKSTIWQPASSYAATLDHEADQIPGRVQVLLTAPGGTFRQKIDAFMNSVVPGVGEIGIDYGFDERNRGNIRVVFNNGSHILSLEELGGGVEQVLAIALVLLGEHERSGALFIEEPEAHMHESAQYELVRLLQEHRGDRQVFIATHSPVFINEFDCARVFRLSREIGKGVKVDPCGTKAEMRTLLSDLGMRLSSLLIANCVVWVEGPSDALLVKHWIDRRTGGRLRIHKHYEILPTGGRILAHFSGDVDGGAQRKLFDILRVNSNGFLIADRDRPSTESRLKPELEHVCEVLGPDRVWVTRGYEIESYYPPDMITHIWGAEVARHLTEHYDGMSQLYGKSGVLVDAGKRSASKVEDARLAVESDLPLKTWFEGRFGSDLRNDLDRLIRFICRVNYLDPNAIIVQEDEDRATELAG